MLIMKNLIEIRKLKKNYKKFELNIDSLEIKKGSITGLIGMNGAGKTTLINCLMNILDCSYESYLFNQREIKYTDHKFRYEIGYVGDSFDAYQNIKLCDITNFYKSVYRKKWSVSKYNSLIELFDLDTSKRVSEISKGMKVKYQFALTLSREVDFLLLDEPTSGLDPIVREEILEILKKTNRTNNVTILFSSHITEDIERISSDLIFINDGRIVLNDSLKNVKDRYRIMEIETHQLPFNINFIKKNDLYILDTKGIDESILEEISKDLKECDLSQILIYLNGDSNEKSDN